MLDDAERKALKAFMTSFAGILTGEMEGTEGIDPSEAPFNITMTQKGEAGAEAEKEAGGEDVEADEEVEEEEVAGEEPAEEAPIKISEAQDYTYIRNKIRRLMR